MSSLDILKQELIKQKQIFEQKGFAVNTKHQYPAPSEITSAIDNINTDMARLSNIALTAITGVGKQKIYIPSNYPKINDYAYYSGEMDIYYDPNFAIPSNITSIGKYAFAYCSEINCEQLIIHENLTLIDNYAFLNCINIKGDLTIPRTCTLNMRAFSGCTGITGIDVYCDFTISASYIFFGCSSIKKAVFHSPITLIPLQICGTCENLEEVYLPATITAINAGAFRSLPSLNFIILEAIAPPTITSTTFQMMSDRAIIFIPYASLASYASEKYFSTIKDRLQGFGDFQEGETLPDSTEEYSLVWYSNIDDLRNGENPLTTAPVTGRFYASKTEIV